MHHLLLLAISSLAGLSSGLRLQVEGRKRAPLRRAIDGVATLKNAGDISYYTSVTLGGQGFSCLIDTGSSDLWVAGTISSAKDTGATSGVNYAVGSAKGPIKTVDMEFAGYEIPNQAFMEVTPDDTNKQGQGILGLGPNSGSNIYNTLESDAGFAVVDRIFLQNTSTPNFISIALGRVQDPDSADSFPGNITVGDILDGYDAITNEAKLEVTTVSVTREGDQHFQILLDQNGLLGPDGNPIAIRTEVEDTSNDYQATAVVDSGFSLSQLPKAAADAIYGRFSGAEYKNVNGVGNTWIVPCDQEVNITFKFSGKEYHIHPLDATLDPSLVGISSLKNSKGQDCCVALFQPIIFDTGSEPTYDMILGMSFMRNVYTLLNYGDFIDEDKNRGDPYIQFLSITDPAEAHTDFVSVRLNGEDTTGSQTLNDLPKSSKGSSIKKPLLYGICGALLLLGLVLMAYAWYLRRRGHKASKKGPVYRPLASPTPPVDMSIMQSGNAPPPRYSMPPQYNPAVPFEQYDSRVPSPAYNASAYSSEQQLYDPAPQPYAPQQAHLYDPQPGPYTSQQNVAYHNPFDARR